ncbi:MBL fold metallo-hydrolase [Tenacibaculum geojense]|uniref:MBL fold metallo-hydrolase n=1 Tax=Tenacibaculum geojense TaxID=915352 RepID=A0ABW3JM63_9FLAO
MNNSELKITFLGTGTSTGVPMIGSTSVVAKSNNPKDKRLRSSIMLTWGDVNYVIDCGPDFRQQMLRENVTKVNGILFTHEHADHIAGFDDIRPFCFKMGDMPIYGLKRVLKVLQKRYDYVFATENRYSSAPSVKQHEISHHSRLELANKTITPLEVMHGNLPILGYRIGNAAYITDIKTMEISEKEKLKNLDVLIVTGLRKEPHATHFNIDEALRFINEIKPKRTYLTHISEPLGLHDKVEKELPQNVFLAYDGLQIVTN